MKLQDSKSENSRLLMQGIKDSLPVFPAYLPLGLVWGILWEQAGFSPVLGVVLSATVYAGAVQFIALSLIISGAPLLSIVAAILPIAIRNSFYVIASLNHLPKKWVTRIYGAFALVDATFAIIISKPHTQASNPWYHIPLSAMIQFSWILGTLIGVYSGSYIPDGIATLDFALPALLTVLIIEQFYKNRTWLPIIAPAIIGIVSMIFIKDYWLIPSLLGCTLLAAFKSQPEGS